MPCYLFTFHAYGSWFPDRPQGYVVRGQGVLPADQDEARKYRQRATHEPATWNAEVQRAVIEQLIESADHLACRLHAAATEPTHVHLLASWADQRAWQPLRTSLKKALTIRLKRQFGDRPWLSGGGSRKRVRDQAHFDELLHRYLPAHGGWKWCETRGEYL